MRQNASDGASIKRAWYHSSIIDVDSLKARHNFDELPKTYIIFITATVIFNKGLPIYKIDRVIEYDNTKVNDGTHIIYANTTYKGMVI